MVPPGLRGSNGQPAAPPYSNGPYTWDQTIFFTADDIGVAFTGAYSDSCIDFSDVTLNHSGSSGPVMIRAGTYGSPVTSSDSGQSGMIRLYSRNSALTDSEASGFYDRGIFIGFKTTGAKGQIPFAGLVEVETTISGDGPTNIKGAEFIVSLLNIGSKLGDSTLPDGMFGAWCKIHAKDGATCHSGSIKAAILLDNQMNGNNAAPGEEYTILALTGGLKPDSFIRFNSTSSGWSNFLSFDSTSAASDFVGTATITGGTADRYLKVDLGGTAYGIQLYAI